MTGTASSRGMSVFDFDNHRNREWLRRRKLRLEQVRKQSNEIAKAIRQKVINEEKARLDEFDRMSEARFRDWKMEKLEELEKKFRCALEDFGKGYRLAEAEPDLEDLIEERHRVNFAKARKRGEIAKQEVIRRRRIAEEQKTSLIERKKLIRKKEDLRSALIHSLPIKKQITDTQTEKLTEEKVHNEKVTFTPVKRKIKSHRDQNVIDVPKKVPANKGRRKKVTTQKSCLCKHKVKSSESIWPSRGSETIWINLNEIQNSSTGDSGVHPASTKSSFESQNQKEKSEGIVEFYDFSSRYYRKSYREFPHLVQRIDPESEVPNAHDLAKIEDQEEKVEAKRKMEADTISQERGAEALRREKINQDYSNLMTKLEELHRKEKVLKAQQRNLPNFLHMNDERLSERLKAKQRLMDSKFENIYYEVMSQMPRAELPRAKAFSREGGGDFAEADDATRPSASSSRLKTNSPVTSDGEPSPKGSFEEAIRKPKKPKRKRQLLLEIDKALKEGRELRKAAAVNRESTSVDEEEENRTEKCGSDSKKVQSPAEVSPCKEEPKTTRCQESQTEDLKVGETGVEEMVLKDFCKTGDDSLPVSTSTSYKSPPSVIRSYRLRQFLEYLDGATETKDDGLIHNNSKYSREMSRILYDLLYGSKKAGAEEERPGRSPTLEYYIEKLLNMSRECIADLSVSSENISTTNITDADLRELMTPEPECLSRAFSGEDLIRKLRLDRADRLEETIRNWKRILGKASEGSVELVDVPDCPHKVPDSPQPELATDEVTQHRHHLHRHEVTSEGKPEERTCIMYNPMICSRYEEITKKCSERISELSNMLDKVRKDKERLLSSTSGGSSLSLNKDERNSEKNLDKEDEEGALERCVGSLEEPRSALVEGFLNRYNLPKPRKETVSTIAVVDSQSAEDPEESLESWPDVMDELLKRKILTSPFKWSDGEFSSELSPLSDTHTKPSSIETVIGNFRKEISKIKPFTLSDSFPQSDSFLRSDIPFDERHEELFGGGKKKSRWSKREQVFQDESSVESINQALTTLGLNWAKSFLRKNEESRAMSSSSNSEGRCSGDEVADYS